MRNKEFDITISLHLFPIPDFYFLINSSPLSDVAAVKLKGRA